MNLEKLVLGMSTNNAHKKFVVVEVVFVFIGVKLNKFHGCRMPWWKLGENWAKAPTYAAEFTKN